MTYPPHLHFHCAVARVYHTPIVGSTSIDLNAFSFFYTGDHYPAVTDMLSGRVDPCVRVCVLRSWPDRPPVYEGTAFVGDSGPEQGVGAIGFFVHRPFLTAEAARTADSLEVMHVRTQWLGGEVRGRMSVLLATLYGTVLHMHGIRSFAHTA